MPTKKTNKNNPANNKTPDVGKNYLIERARVLASELQARGLDRSEVYDQIRLKLPKLPKEHCKSIAGYSKGYSTTALERYREDRIRQLPLSEMRKRVQQSDGYTLYDNLRPLTEIRDSSKEAARDRVSASRVIGEQAGYIIKDQEQPTQHTEIHQAIQVIQQINVNPSDLAQVLADAELVQ